MTTSERTREVLRHGRMDLALWTLRPGTGRPLLLLHGLGERTPERVPAVFDSWTGPIVGLDFSGHGDSSVTRGGGYTAEILVADANTALDHVGEATIVGRGLGAYVGLLLAGARADAVRGVVLADGPGLVGGGVQPPSPSVPFALTPPESPAPGRALHRTPDPFALLELAADVRPPDYVSLFVGFALEGSSAPDPIIVSAVARADWLDAVADHPGVLRMGLREAVAKLSAD